MPHMLTVFDEATFKVAARLLYEDDSSCKSTAVTVLPAMQVPWDSITGTSVTRGPAATSVSQHQCMFASLAWLPDLPIALVMDCQGTCAAISCQGQPVTAKLCMPHDGSHAFNNLAFEGARAACMTYGAWRPGNLAPPQTW